jgi:antitoxin HicB
MEAATSHSRTKGSKPSRNQRPNAPASKAAPRLIVAPEAALYFSFALRIAASIITDYRISAIRAIGFSKEVKMAEVQDYRVVIGPLSEEDGGGYGATVPDLPGCMSDGETPQEALENVYDAIACWIHACVEAGRTVPEPESRGMIGPRRR